MKKILLFDLDGTLVDSRKDLVNAANWTRAQFGLPPLPFETVVSFIGRGMKNLVLKSLGKKEYLEKGLSLFRSYYSKHCLDHTRPYEGIPELLEELSRSHSLAVVTNKPEEFSEKILKGLHLFSYFPVLIGGDTLEKKKPDPAPLLEAVTRLQGNHSEVIMIGDSETDLEAGKRAGVKTCAVAYGFRPLQVLLTYQPDFVVHSVSELGEVLR